MYTGQITTIEMALESALRGVIKELATDPKLKDVEPAVLTRAIITCLVRKVGLAEIQTLIEIHRRDAEFDT